MKFYMQVELESETATTPEEAAREALNALSDPAAVAELSVEVLDENRVSLGVFSLDETGEDQ